MVTDDQTRRRFLKLGGATLAAGVAGCSRGRRAGSTDSPGDELAGGTERSTGDRSPVPATVSESEWEDVLGDVGAAFVDVLLEDGEFTERGTVVAEILVELADARVEVARAIARKGAVDEHDLGILRSLLANPLLDQRITDRTGNVTLQELFGEYGLETEPVGDGELYQLERALMGLEDERTDGLPPAFFEARAALLTRGRIGAAEADVYLHTGRYLSDRINGVRSEIEQVNEAALFERIADEQRVTEATRQAFVDANRNGLIQRNDVSEGYSATPDPYGTGFVQDLLALDPEKPTVAYLWEATSDADPALVEHALAFMAEMYHGDGFQTVLIEGRRDREPFPEHPETHRHLGDLCRERAPALIEEVPCHYLLFAEYDQLQNGRHNLGMNGAAPTRRSETGYALVNTVRSSTGAAERRAVEFTVMAETFDTLYDRTRRGRIEQWYREGPDGLSEEGTSSYSSYGFWDEAAIHRKAMTDVEREMVLESKLGLDVDGSAFQTALLRAAPALEHGEQEYVRRLSAEALQIGL